MAGLLQGEFTDMRNPVHVGVGHASQERGSVTGDRFSALASASWISQSAECCVVSFHGWSVDVTLADQWVPARHLLEAPPWGVGLCGSYSSALTPAGSHSGEWRVEGCRKMSWGLTAIDG